jgi:hypothetical protein
MGEDAGAAIDNDGLPETGLDTPRRDDLSTGGQTADDRSESGDATPKGATVEPVEEAPEAQEGQGRSAVVSPPLDTGEHAVTAGSSTAPDGPPATEPSGSSTISDAQAALPGGGGSASSTAKAQPSRRRRFMLPVRRFGRRKKEGLEGTGAGLTERVRSEAAKGDVSLENGAWAAAVLHYDDAIASLEPEIETGGPESIGAAEIYLKRGRALVGQSRVAVIGGGDGSISDYHIGIEMGRRAIGDYTEAIRLNPIAAAYCLRGEARVQTSQCERGTKSFRRASQYLAEALDDFTRALELEPALAAAYAGRAVAHAGLGQDAEADADAEQAVALGADAAALREAMRKQGQQAT